MRNVYPRPAPALAQPAPIPPPPPPPPPPPEKPPPLPDPLDGAGVNDPTALDRERRRELSDRSVARRRRRAPRRTRSRTARSPRAGCRAASPCASWSLTPSATAYTRYRSQSTRWPAGASASCEKSREVVPHAEPLVVAALALGRALAEQGSERELHRCPRRAR